jgi:membrane-associated phospholipid phosphatase
MAYLALWGLLFSFGIILFRGTRCWRILLLVVSALFVALVGPSRIYLGAHWASDVLGSYLIGGALLGITLWFYLQLKRRGVLESKAALRRTGDSKVFRSFSPR